MEDIFTCILSITKDVFFHFDFIYQFSVHLTFNFTSLMTIQLMFKIFHFKCINEQLLWMSGKGWICIKNGTAIYMTMKSFQNKHKYLEWRRTQLQITLSSSQGQIILNVPFLHTILKSILHKKKTTCIINCGEKHYASFRTISFSHINNKAWLIDEKHCQKKKGNGAETDDKKKMGNSSK